MVNGEIDAIPACVNPTKSRQSSHHIRHYYAMGEFFANVSRYPKYLITIILGVFASLLGPLIQRSRNPVTGVALIGALISGVITLSLILRAMVNPTPITGA